MTEQTTIPEPDAVPDTTEPPLPPEMLPPLPADPPVLGPPAPSVRRDRRALRAVLRWTTAVLVCGSLGTATAYGITGQKRTDVPGLATRDDGRWSYPTLTRPPVPEGAPRTFDEVNKAENHAADLRALLLPAPRGATPDPRLAGKDGWLPTGTYLAQYEKDSRQELADGLVTDGLRHIAARGWTMQDGTRVRIFLLQFPTGAAAEKLHTDLLSDYERPKSGLAGAAALQMDQAFPGAAEVDDTTRYVYEEQAVTGEHDRLAYIVAGDTVALVVESRKGPAPRIPFEQTVVLQNQLLG